LRAAVVPIDARKEGSVPTALLLRANLNARSRSRVEGDKCIGMVAFKRRFPRREGTNSRTHFSLWRGQDFGEGDISYLFLVSDSSGKSLISPVVLPPSLRSPPLPPAIAKDLPSGEKESVETGMV
jgi:hypothetical protein